MVWLLPSDIKHGWPASTGCPSLLGMSSKSPMLANISSSTRLSTYTQSVFTFESPILKGRRPNLAKDTILGKCLSSPSPYIAEGRIAHVKRHFPLFFLYSKETTHITLFLL